MATKHHVGYDGILDAAEGLFRERGFQAVTLTDVAQAVGIRKPSLYYHFPEGKEQLFVAVQERMFQRIGDQLELAIQAAPPSLDAQLQHAAKWFFQRPPLFLLAMIHHDMPALSEEHRKSLTAMSYGVIMRPLVQAVQTAVESGEIREVNPHVVAGGFISLLEGTTIAARAGFGHNVEEMMVASLDMVMNGLRPNSSEK
ncbi:MAG: TetR/AcrR family transcriptional regulator [Alkalispirochaeta sp.]